MDSVRGLKANRGPYQAKIIGIHYSPSLRNGSVKTIYEEQNLLHDLLMSTTYITYEVTSYKVVFVPLFFII